MCVVQARSRTAAGEVDYFEQPAVDLTPIMAANPDITVEVNDPLGNIGFARFNHLIPPFDKPEIRRAAEATGLPAKEVGWLVRDPAGSELVAREPPLFDVAWRSAVAVPECGYSVLYDRPIQ